MTGQTMGSLLGSNAIIRKNIYIQQMDNGYTIGSSMCQYVATDIDKCLELARQLLASEEGS